MGETGQSTIAAVKIKLVVEYDGAKFHGWQVQPGMRTIQAELQQALEIFLRTSIPTIRAAGRTDSGVHARAQVISAIVPRETNLMRLTHAVSSLLRGEVSIRKATIMPDDFDPLRCAQAKQYSYSILRRAAPAVLDRGRVWHVYAPLDLDRMRREAAVLVGKQDFSSFQGKACSARSTVKEIFSSKLIERDDLLIYEVLGSGFLKQMVRNIVGTLVWFGQGHLTHTTMVEILAAHDRRAAGPTAPAHGLCLDWVSYPDKYNLDGSTGE